MASRKKSMLNEPVSSQAVWGLVALLVVGVWFYLQYLRPEQILKSCTQDVEQKITELKRKADQNPQDIVVGENTFFQRYFGAEPTVGPIPYVSSEQRAYSDANAAAGREYIRNECLKSKGIK